MQVYAVPSLPKASESNPFCSLKLLKLITVGFQLFFYAFSDFFYVLQD